MRGELARGRGGGVFLHLPCIIMMVALSMDGILPDISMASHSTTVLLRSMETLLRCSIPLPSASVVLAFRRVLLTFSRLPFSTHSTPIASPLNGIQVNAISSPSSAMC